MKQVIATRFVDIPDDVEFEVRARKVKVKGPRGSLVREFKHLAVDMFVIEEDGMQKLQVEAHFGKRKALASIRTVCSHVTNLIKGVSAGFEYKMRLVYAHFPINVNIEDGGKLVEIRNFLGEKRVRAVNMLPGVTISRSTGVKDELVLQGNDIEEVSKSAALINYQCHVRNKDIRKFLDGIYISERGNVVKAAD
ncbi:g12802 [Coccomyxa viridis]|uniref:G12802 protein n=1 Tax=Coccomyxa viridis TaxID=1274662 RepID=A0ABP1GB98_9CHLO